MWDFRFSQQCCLWFKSSGMCRFVLFGRVATDTLKYHRAVYSGSTLQADCLILLMKTLRFFERAGTVRPVVQCYFPEATILRYNMVEQTALNLKENGKIMSLRRGPYCKLRGTEWEIKEGKRRVQNVMVDYGSVVLVW
jgi:hypothetical protein